MFFTPLTRKAMLFAYQAHHGQLDDDGIPYVFHPARVAAGFTDEVGACAAWLHDVVEDTDANLEDLRAAGFPEEVCRVLALLTHEEGVPYMDYVKKLAEDPIAKAVKLADLQDNANPLRQSVWTEHVETRMKKHMMAYRYLTGAEDTEA